MLRLLVILSLLAGTVLRGQDAPKHQKPAASAATNQPADPGNPIPESVPAVKPSVSAPQSQPAAPEKQQETPPKPLSRFLRPEWVIVWVTIIYTILTGFTLRAIKRQADLMAAQLRDGQKNSAESAKTTQSTLDALTLQAKALDEQAKNTASQIGLMKRQINIGINKERAKLFVELVPANWTFLIADYERVITYHPDFGSLCMEIDSFKIAISNEGESTAYNTSCGYSVTVIEDKTGNSLISETRNVSIGRLKPGEKPVTMGVDFFPCLPSVVLDPIHASQATLKFSGSVLYEDAFEPDNLHQTHFCYVWQIDGEYVESVGSHGDGFYVDQSRWVTTPPEANRST